MSILKHNEFALSKTFCRAVTWQPLVVEHQQWRPWSPSCGRLPRPRLCQRRKRKVRKCQLSWELRIPIPSNDWRASIPSLQYILSVKFLPSIPLDKGTFLTRISPFAFPNLTKTLLGCVHRFGETFPKKTFFMAFLICHCTRTNAGLDYSFCCK